jgi:hypothetical protein
MQVKTYCAVADDLEQSSDHKWNEEVCLCPDHLIEVQSSHCDKCEDEDDCTSHAWIIAVESKISILSRVRHFDSNRFLFPRRSLMPSLLSEVGREVLYRVEV